MTYFEPSLPALLIIGLIGCVRTWLRSGPGRRPWLETISLLGILFLSTEAGAWLLARPLESEYSNNPYPQGSAGAIVVLAGTVVPPSSLRPYALPAEDTYRRVEHAVWLYRYWKPLPILVCGGPSLNSPPYAETMRRTLLSEGIPASVIWLESRSGNTHENAVFGAEILKQRGVSRIVLVVEAAGMPRASRAFARQGISVVPSPVWRNHLTREFSDYIPGWRGIELNGDTIHEMVGLLYYKFRGWI